MNQNVLIHSALALLLGCGSTGCMAIGSAQTAQTLGQGNYEGSVELGTYGAVVNGKNLPMANVNVAYRLGITDRIDVGGRIGSTLAELQGKVLLSDPANEKFALSLAPAIGGFTLGTSRAGAGLLSIPVPVLIGFKFGEHELTLGPRVQNVVAFAGAGNTSAAAYSLLLGTSIGFAAQLGKNFRLMPEIALAVPVYASASASSGSSAVMSSGFLSTVGSFIYTANLGIQYGSPRKKYKKPDAK